MVAQAYNPEEFITPEEYLERERRAETRSEYVNGRIYAMAGGSRTHNTLTMNIAGLLHSQLRGKPCQPWSQDMRVRVPQTTLYTYPDVVVVCPPARFSDDQFDTLLNPQVIIGVLSPSTEAYDRGDKFEHYKRLESLTDYILVAQDTRRIEHHRRLDNGDWLQHVVHHPDHAVTIESIDCRLVVSEVYERVELPNPSESRAHPTSP